MGVGDEIMATGMARGAYARGKRVAFGDGKRIIRGPWCEIAFRHNPNIAQNLAEPVEWIHYYKGNRHYNKLGNGRWIWNYDFKARPGEFFFDGRERAYTIRTRDAVLIEPNVPWQKSVAVNKDWGMARFQALVERFKRGGFQVFQLSHGRNRLEGVHVIEAPDFRCAAAALAGFQCIVTPEGGLHHAAAAVGAPAVVLFGGFVPPAVLGYDSHLNLTGGAGEACGSLNMCAHCRKALDNISVDEVYDCGRSLFSEAATAPRRA